MGQKAGADVEDGAKNDDGKEAKRGLERGEVVDLLKEEAREPFHDVQDGK